jgi:hypothetical protein
MLVTIANDGGEGSGGEVPGREVGRNEGGGNEGGGGGAAEVREEEVRSEGSKTEENATDEDRPKVSGGSINRLYARWQMYSKILEPIYRISLPHTLSTSPSKSVAVPSQFEPFVGS